MAPRSRICAIASMVLPDQHQADLPEAGTGRSAEVDLEECLDRGARFGRSQVLAESARGGV